MAYYSPSIEKLIQSFEKLPSIGHKTAVRLAFYILNASNEEADEFITNIKNAKTNLKFCSKCYNISDTDPCEICSDPKRDQTKICVVEDVKDVVAIEKINEYKGLYHVLHGTISPMDGVGPDDIKIKELIARLQDGTVKENHKRNHHMRRNVDMKLLLHSSRNRNHDTAKYRFHIHQHVVALRMHLRMSDSHLIGNLGRRRDDQYR